MLKLYFSPFPSLVTERLSLRRLYLKDANEIKLLRSNDVVNQHIDRPNKITLDEVKKFIKKINSGIQNNEWIYWAITLKNSEKLIGTICYWNIDVKNMTGEIGFELSPEFHRKGIMQEAITKVIKFGKENLKFKVITAFSNKKNQGSIKLLKRNNFQLDKNYAFANNEEFSDLICYFLK